MNYNHILITGGAGSIGSLFVKGLIDEQFGGDVYILDCNETELVMLQESLQLSSSKVHFILGDFGDEVLMKSVLNGFPIELVVHCAAYKHVVFGQIQLCAMIKNNLEKLDILLKLFSNSKTSKHFLFISTDKAVNPVSIMGMTKRIGEGLVKSYSNTCSGKIFSAIRFGNVINSRGSILKRFENQWKNEGQIKVSDFEAKRFSIEKQEVFKLLKQAIHFKKKLMIGDYRKLISVKDWVELFLEGKELDKSKEYVKVIGLQEGEKLEEELLYSFEKIKTHKEFKGISEVSENKEIPECFRNDFMSLIQENSFKESSVVRTKLNNLIKLLNS